MDFYYGSYKGVGGIVDKMENSYCSSDKLNVIIPSNIFVRRRIK